MAGSGTRQKRECGGFVPGRLPDRYAEPKKSFFTPAKNLVIQKLQNLPSLLLQTPLFSQRFMKKINRVNPSEGCKCRFILCQNGSGDEDQNSSRMKTNRRWTRINADGRRLFYHG